MSRNTRFVEITLIGILAMLIGASPAYAWQLGGTSSQANGASGIRASQLIAGTVPSGYWFGAESAFTDNGGIWHLISVTYNYASAGTYAITGEYEDSTGYHDTTLCTGTYYTYYDDQIQWVSSSTEWLYQDNTVSGCKQLAVIESSTSNKVSGNSIDLMESTDNTGSDFSSHKAYAYFNPTLYYYSSGWTHTTKETSWDSSAPSTIGQYFACSGSGHYVLATYVDSSYAPPQGTGSYIVSC